MNKIKTSGYQNRDAHSQSLPERDAYFDNLKFVLICLVTIGHFLLPMERVRFIYNIYYFIYAFHMPCFILVSGYFTKSLYQDGIFKVRKLFCSCGFI